MKRRRFLVAIVLLVMALPLVILFWQVDRLNQQEYLNHALIAAIKAQNRQRVLELLAQGADANTHVTSEFPSFVQMLRRQFSLSGRKHAPATSEHHPSALLVASMPVFVGPNYKEQRSDEEIILALLAHGAATNEMDSEGWSPIRYAVWDEHTRALRSLLEHGADPNEKEVNLQSNGSHSGITFLKEAIYYNEVETARLLITYGADVNTPASNGATPLISAVNWGDTEIVALLLQHGAKPEARTKEGHTALWYALRDARESNRPQFRKIIALLKQCGAKE